MTVRQYQSLQRPNVALNTHTTREFVSWLKWGCFMFKPAKWNRGAKISRASLKDEIMKLIKGTPAGHLVSGSEEIEGVTAPAALFSSLALIARHVSQWIMNGVKQLYCSDAKQHQEVLYSAAIQTKNSDWSIRSVSQKTAHVRSRTPNSSGYNNLDCSTKHTQSDIHYTFWMHTWEWRGEKNTTI